MGIYLGWLLVDICSSFEELPNKIKKTYFLKKIPNFFVENWKYLLEKKKKVCVEINFAQGDGQSELRATSALSR